MTEIGNIALQTGGSLGTLVIIILFARPYISKLFENQDKSIILQQKNIEALSDVTESMKAHDKRAEKRAGAIMKAFDSKINSIDRKIDGIEKNNKEYGDALIKVYNHMAEKAGFKIKEGDIK